METKIVSVETVAPEYALLTFLCDEGLDGQPGQFVMIRGQWGTDPVLPRAFSIVQSGEMGQVLVRDVGKGTRRLCRMHPGDDLQVLGPLGNGYSMPSRETPAVLVAGGVGVAPLVFMARQLVARRQSVSFVYGAKTDDDLPMLETIESLCPTVVTTESGATGQQGRVTDALGPLLARLGQPAAVYSCGPHPMLRAVGEVARQKGAALCEVALESPMACGMGTCKGCAVVKPDGSFVYVCSDGPVFDCAEIWRGDQ